MFGPPGGLVAAEVRDSHGAWFLFRRTPVSLPAPADICGVLHGRNLTTSRIESCCSLPMPRNVEIKARVDDLAAVRARVETLTSAPAEYLTQTDTFFRVPHGRLKLRELGDGTAELIFYDRPDQPGPKASTYTRCPVADAELLRTVLTASVGVRGVVRKERDVFLHEQTRIHLDRVEGLGSFLELEVAIGDDEPLSAGEAIAREILRFLDVADEQLIASAYIDLLADD